MHLSRKWLPTWLFALLLFTGCSRSPRRESFLSPLGEKQVIVRAPRSDAGDIRLVHLRDIRGEDFPFDPPIWRVGDLTSDESGRLYLADWGHNHIVVMDGAGHYLGRIGRKGPGPFEFRDTSISPDGIAWIPAADVIVATEPDRMLLFHPDGEPLVDERKPFNAYGLAATRDRFIRLDLDPRPFTLCTPDGLIESRFGRPFGPEDALWPLTQDELRALPQQVDFGWRGIGLVHYALVPTHIAVLDDTLLVHENNYRNSYRGWNLRTWTVAWEIRLAYQDYEPPTFYTYTTSALTEMIRWDEGGEPIEATRTFALDLVARDGFWFAATMFYGRTHRREPDRATATNPYTVHDELYSRWEIHCALEIMTPEPDLLAHVYLEEEQPLFFEVTRSHLLVVAVNDPLPHLTVYRIEGLWP